MKRAILKMPANFLHFAFIQHIDYHVKVEHGLPDDAKFCACHYDHMRHVFQLIYESKEFEDIPEGEKMPVLDDVIATFVNDCQPVITEQLIPQYEE